jgi:hypothetical protein
VSLRIGDEVFAYHESQGIIGSYPITAVLVHEDQLIVDLIIDGESLTTTPEHPFYTLAGWEVAGELEVGDHIWSISGEWGRVEAVSVSHDPQLMYNLTVDDAHTFFVGEQAWLVHNTCFTGFSTANNPPNIRGSLNTGTITPEHNNLLSLANFTHDQIRQLRPMTGNAHTTVAVATSTTGEIFLFLNRTSDRTSDGLDLIKLQALGLTTQEIDALRTSGSIVISVPEIGDVTLVSPFAPSSTAVGIVPSVISTTENTHAETLALSYFEQNKLTMNFMAVSRPPCPNSCMSMMTRSGVPTIWSDPRGR